MPHVPDASPPVRVGTSSAVLAAAAVVAPVPPLAIATVPVTLAAVPDTLPVTLPVRFPVTFPVTAPVSGPDTPAVAVIRPVTVSVPGMETTPVELIVNREEPAVDNATLSAAGKKIPVLVSPVGIMEGLAAVPALTANALDVVKEVNEPVEGDDAPIAVPSIVPPLMSAVVTVSVGVINSVTRSFLNTSVTVDPVPTPSNRKTTSNPAGISKSLLAL